MVFLDFLLLLILFGLLYFVGYPLLRNVILRKRDTTENVGPIEEEVESAIQKKEEAEKATAAARQKAEDLFHKAEELRKKV